MVSDTTVSVLLLDSNIKIPSGSWSVRRLMQRRNLVTVLQAERHSMLQPGKELGADKTSVSSHCEEKRGKNPKINTK